MHQHDDEAQSGADGDDDTFAVDVVGVSAVDLILTQAIETDRVIPEIRLRAPRSKRTRDYEPKPQQKIARDIGAGMDRSLAVQEHEDISDVPQYRKPQRDELPGQVIVVPVVGPGVVYVAVVGGGGGREEGRVREGPPDEAGAREGEDDGQGAEDVFPEEGGVVGVDLLAGAEGGEHGWGRLQMRFGFFVGMRGREEEMYIYLFNLSVDQKRAFWKIKQNNIPSLLPKYIYTHQEEKQLDAPSCKESKNKSGMIEIEIEKILATL